MFSSIKNLWVVFVLIAAGIAILFFALGHKPQSGGVELREIFDQKPPQQSPEDQSPAIADPVSSPAIVTSPEGSLEAGYAVQVYSFQDGTRAEKAVADLKSGGYNTFLIVSDLGAKGMWYRVRVGPLANEKEAEAMLHKIQKNYQSGFIVKPKK